MTHRQYLVWMAWLEAKWNTPNSMEHYLMQIACEIARGNSKRPSAVRMEQFKLEFSRQKPPTKAQKIAATKQRAIQRVGGKVEMRREPDGA